MCQSAVPPSQATCHCGYSFQPEGIEAEAQNLILAAQEEEAYLDYLQARYIQANEALRVIKKRLEIDSNNADLKVECKAAENGVFRAQQELNEMNTKLAQTRKAAQTAKSTLLQVRARKERRAARQKAKQQAEINARKMAEDQARQQAERRLAEEQARLAAEQQAREEAARKLAEQQALAEARLKEQAESERKAKAAAQQQAAQEYARKQAEKKAKQLESQESAEQQAREAAARKIEQEAASRQEQERNAREEAAQRIEQEAINREAKAAKAREKAKQNARLAAEQVRHAAQKAEKIRAAAYAAEMAARAHLDNKQQYSSQPVITTSAPPSFTLSQAARAQAALAQAQNVTATGNNAGISSISTSSGLGTTPADYMNDHHPELFADNPANQLISHTSSVNPHADDVCPHCTATMKPGASKCGCGYERYSNDDADGLALSLTDTDHEALASTSGIQVSKFG